MEAMKWVLNRMPKSGDKYLSVMSAGNVEKAQAFHCHRRQTPTG